MVSAEIEFMVTAEIEFWFNFIFFLSFLSVKSNLSLDQTFIKLT